MQVARALWACGMASCDARVFVCEQNFADMDYPIRVSSPGLPHDLYGLHLLIAMCAPPNEQTNMARTMLAPYNSILTHHFIIYVFFSTHFILR